jgi:hypothetical protein
MPESVFTHTMPLLFAGGVCCWVWAGVEDFEVEADLLDPDDDEAGAELEGAGAGAGAGVDAGLELALPELDALDEPEAELPDASAEVSDFFDFFFFVVALESLELSVPAELDVG